MTHSAFYNQLAGIKYQQNSYNGSKHQHQNSGLVILDLFKELYATPDGYKHTRLATSCLAHFTISDT